MNKKQLIILASTTTVVIVAAILITLFLTRRGNNNEEEHTSDTRPPLIDTAPTPLPEQPSDEYMEVADQFTIAPAALGLLSITPQNTGNLGIQRDTAFLITSGTQTLTESHLRNYLTVRRPGSAEYINGERLILEQQADNSFLLRLTQELSPAQIYNIVYSPTGMQPTSHAFQTADIFRITGTTPANSTHNIPHDSGIEVTFTHALANERDFASHFVINPPVEGRFLRRDNTYIFAPNNLEFNTVYTVTILAGLTDATGETLAEDHTFSFTTRWGTAEGRPFSIAGRAYETFLPWTEVIIALHVNSPYTNFNVRLYNLHTAENFLNFNNENEKEHIENFELELFSVRTDYVNANYLLLDRTLPEGYYLAIISSPQERDGMELMKFIQVSALSVYSLSIAGEMVFWVHDATTHQPAAGATVNIGSSTVTTDQQGIAIAQIGYTSQAAITITYGNYLPFAYTKRTFAPTPLTMSDRFLTYMYTDRPTYRPSDVVDIFGVIMPRYGHSHLPGDVFTLHIGDMVELPITLDAHHAFSVRVPVEGMFGGIIIRVDANGERVMSTWVNFLDYTNISFVLDGQTCRNAYFFGDTMNLEISATNFAGTPIEGLHLRNSAGTLTIITDENGIAAGETEAGWSHLREPQSWQPWASSVWFNVASDTQRSQSISLRHILAPRDIMMEVEQQASSPGTAVLTTNRITLDRFNADSSLSTHDVENFRGEVVDVDFTVTITRHVTTRTLRSQFYDHINRRNVNIYDFDTTQSVYRTINERTQGGRATVTGLPQSNDPLIRYSVQVTYNDSRGLPVSLWIGASWFPHPANESSIRLFSFIMEGRTLAEGEWEWDWHVRDARVGETISVALRESDDIWGSFHNATTPTSGRVLAILARDGALYTSVGSPESTQITFPESAISSAMLFGAYFADGYIFSISQPISVFYDYTERELQVELNFDRELYAPGDEVTVTINTTNAAGQPVPSRVTLSVVDESSIVSQWGGPHRANLLSRLYRSSPVDSWMFMFEQFASHTQHNFGIGGGGAEGGGGDDAGRDPVFRDDFTDNPIFETVQTDANGMATFTFTLPHQVTSWRVTALGLAESGLAGDARPNIISTLPFFVDLILTNEYIAGDDIAAVARIFTDGSMNREPVNFVFQILQDGEVIFADEIQTATTRVEFNAGKLDIGAYTMRVNATMGNYSDGIELPFTVVETGLIIPVSMQQQISLNTPPNMDFAMRNLPVRVTLSNANIRPLMNILHDSLDWRSVRTDQLAARAFINNFHGWQDLNEDVSIRIHADSGGISELPYEEPSLRYTARFAASFPEFVNREQIIRFARGDMNIASNTVRSARLLALAAVGEPVLFDIQEEINHLLSYYRGEMPFNYHTYLSIITLASALVAIGDDTGANELMNRYIPEFEGILSNSQRETINATLLFINTKLNPPAAWAMLRGTERNSYVSNVPERINFVRHAIVLGENISEAEFYLNGQTETVRLENFATRTLHITPEQFYNLNLTATSGDTDMFVQFYGYDSANWAEEDNRLNIRKTIARDGDLYLISLFIDFPYGDTGVFTIYDRLPSNMRFVPSQQSWQLQRGNWASIRNPQRQLMEITFHRTRYCIGTRVVSYHAMKLFDADMSYGVTYISNRSTTHHLWGSSR